MYFIYIYIYIYTHTFGLCIKNIIYEKMHGMESFKIIGVKTSKINQQSVAIDTYIFVYIHFVCVLKT